MRIAILGHKRFPSREGGVEVVVQEMAVRMVEQGHSVTCYNRSGKHIAGSGYDQQRLSEYKGVKIRWVPSIDKRGLAAVTSSFAASICAALGPYDIVHYHAEGPAFMCLIPKLFGKKVVVTVHGLDHKRGKWGKIGKTVILKGERNATRHADAIIVLSGDVRRYFWETYGRETRLIRNGVTLLTMRDASIITERFGLKKDEYMLYLGRLVPEKGLVCLIEAYQRINTSKKLVIAGSGSDTDDFVRRLHDMAYGNKNIIFTGFVEGELLEELYSNAYLYVLPSYLEGMPLSLMEAMSCGCCCVTSDIPECTDVTGEGGYSFHAEDSDDLASLLQDLCERREDVEACRTIAVSRAKHFNWDVATKETLALYEQLLRAGRRNADGGGEEFI